MAKAKDKSITTQWIWLIQALQEATRALGSKRLARRRLKQWMATGELPWSCMSLDLLDEQGRVMTGPQLGSLFLLLNLFWDATSHWIDWEDNCAGENELGAVQVMGISVSRERLCALLMLSGELRAGENSRGAAAWITAEVRQMNATGEIPADIKITDLARRIEQRMADAAKRDPLSLRAIKWKSIRNQLVEWGLWPVTLIK
ncbi:hypothetical protein G6321_00039245 [Bradyrhizobium barranii subsp. barranii]|uniref:Uncharacterized protein n=1 Tax=Bradyrhizobium barranii subsp. barranii TaxID=2823807 RepID=A0A7Z0QFB1_9BRAD|nr:hypothetical protein [Bradyrhizobium barranii]UGX91738.1 hypothetical protein G6321_00039245 [Bradyrhizobium barranii subsp. barranii]